MSEMKSAWEIALEKTQKLEKASPEELRRQKEEEQAAVAQALAQKLLDGLDLRSWEIEFEKQPPESREFIKGRLLVHLREAINLEDWDKSRRSLSGVRFLRRDTDLQAVEQKLEELRHEYTQAREALKHELEQPNLARLLQVGISGSAIADTNPLADPHGQKRLKEVSGPYDERLQEIKRELPS